MYLLTWVESGIGGLVGLLLFAWMLNSSYLRAKRIFGSLGEMDGVLAARAMQICLAAFLLTGLSAYLLQFSMKNFWLLSGMGVALEGIARSSERSASGMAQEKPRVPLGPCGRRPPWRERCT